MNISRSEGLMPKEEVLEIGTRRSKLVIGIPRENSAQERRVALVPDAVGLLVQDGHTVIIENGAGSGARFHDHEYSEAGAQLVPSAAEAYKADIILKIAPPSGQELGLMKDRQTLVSAVQLPNQDPAYFRALSRKKVTALAYEYIQDSFGHYPIRRSISEIVGNAAMMIAAKYLSDAEIGKGNMVGGFTGITPTKVIILGAGTVGENAARVAIGMGAEVKVFDDSLYRLRRFQSGLPNRIFTSIMQPKVLAKTLATADVVIGAIHSAEGKTHCVVTEEMVSQMKSGAVIIDVSIDQGGCVETSRVTTHQDPVYLKYDVIHYCVPNIASQVPHTASYALSNVLTPVLMKMAEEGGVDSLIRRDHGICKGVYLYQGVLTSKAIGDHFNLPFQDIELLLTAYH